MAQFRISNRNDRFGFKLSLDARITEFKMSNTADLIGNLILVGVDPETLKWVNPKLNPPGFSQFKPV